MADQMPAHGTFCWNELMTRDTEKAGKFYQELIGWTQTEDSMSESPYFTFKTGEKMNGGMMPMPPDTPDQVPAHWMAYITVDDVDATTAKVADLGGTVMHGPMDIPKVGRFSVIQDPTGAVVGIITLAAPEK